jgi:urease accessory protein
MLQVFRALPVAHAVCRSDALPERSNRYRRETITLGWDERQKTRGRRRSDQGSEFATALPRGTVLRHGETLVLDELALVVAVVERKEPVFVVRPESGERAALFAYYIGNSHQPIMLDRGAIVCADVPGMQQVLEQYGIPFERAERPFTPISGMADHRHGV